MDPLKEHLGPVSSKSAASRGNDHSNLPIPKYESEVEAVTNSIKKSAQYSSQSYFELCIINKNVFFVGHSISGVVIKTLDQVQVSKVRETIESGKSVMDSLMMIFNNFTDESDVQLKADLSQFKQATKSELIEDSQFLKVPVKIDLKQLCHYLKDGDIALVKDVNGIRQCIGSSSNPNPFTVQELEGLTKQQLDEKGNVIDSKTLYGYVCAELGEVVAFSEKPFPYYYEENLSYEEVDGFFKKHHQEPSFRPIVVSSNSEEWGVYVWDVKTDSTLYFKKATVESIDTKVPQVMVTDEYGREVEIPYKVHQERPFDVAEHYMCVSSKVYQIDGSIKPVPSPRTMVIARLSTHRIKWSIQNLLNPNQVYSRKHNKVFTLCQSVDLAMLKSHAVRVLGDDLTEMALDIWSSEGPHVQDLVFSERVPLDPGVVFVNIEGHYYGSLGKITKLSIDHSVEVELGECNVIFSKSEVIWSGLSVHQSQSVVDVEYLCESLDLRIRSLTRELSERFLHLNELYSKMVESSQFRPEVSKFFPKLNALFIGQYALTDELEEIARTHLIKILGGRDGLIKLNNSKLGIWTQDYLSVRRGVFQVPIIVHKNKHFSSQQLRGEVAKSYGIKNFDQALGGVMLTRDRENVVALAMERNIPVQSMLTYSEGGNTLSGHREDGTPFIIIGMDTVRINQDEFTKLGLGDEELKKAFALDYGVKVEDVFYVEQPGDFHLDMKMTIVGHNMIMLNDARLSNEFLVKYKGLSPEEAQRWTEFSEIDAQWEDVCEKQLKEQGFDVKRVAGDFKNYTESYSEMNYFNMVQIETPRGEKIILALGCISYEFEELFKKSLELCGLDCRNIQVYFLDKKASQESLKLCGGIACQVKGVVLESFLKGESQL